MADLSQLSDDDLKKLYADDFKSVSEEGINALKTQQEEAAKAEAETKPAPQANVPVAPAKEKGFYDTYVEPVVTNTVGSAITAGNLAAEYPKTAAVATELGLAALPQSVASKLPVVSQASQLAKLPFQLGNGVLENWQMKNINDMAESIRKAERFGQDTTAMKEQLQRMINNLPKGSAPVSAPPTPVVPTGAPTAGPVVPPTQTAAPMAQAAEQVAAKAPSMLDKTTSMIRQLAASKVMQNLGKGMTGLQLATYSPELGPKTPQVGRMRGMEINPLTGAPWTPDQIKQYESNPMMFDQQLAQPQMRR